MDAGSSPPAQFERILTWLVVNRTRVMWIAAVTIGLVVIISLYFGYESRREARASAALSDVPISINVSTSLPPESIEGFLHVAEKYAGTKAAGRALLMAAGALFMDGEYDRAEAQFSRFLREYPGTPWAGQATLGKAKCLDAKGQHADAETEYEEVRKRFANTPIADEAALSLARVYEALDKPEEAIKLYHSLSETVPGSVGAQAGLFKEELIKENPALTNSLPQPPPPAASTPPPTIPFTLTNIPAQPTVTQAVPNLTNIIRLTPTTAAPVTVVTSTPVPVPMTNVIEVEPETGPTPTNLAPNP